MVLNINVTGLMTKLTDGVLVTLDDMTSLSVTQM